MVENVIYLLSKHTIQIYNLFSFRLLKKFLYIKYGKKVALFDV
jgi:hypothetical protein